jgi:hypothetical protein
MADLNPTLLASLIALVLYAVAKAATRAYRSYRASSVKRTLLARGMERR